MSGEVTQGRRVQNVGEVYGGEPGVYTVVTEVAGGRDVLWFKDPSGHVGRTGQHELTEHEDGTVTVSPSLLATVKEHGHDWHGFLERGVWRAC